MIRWGRLVAVLGLAAVVAGCAQPGQLGSPVPEPVVVAAPAPPPAATPAPPAGPVLVGTGRLDGRVSVRTAGPTVFSVRTVVLPPGGTTGWHRHAGSEMSIVESGAVTVLRGDRCAPTRYAAGDALFVPDAEPHVARNDGTEPAELVVTYLLEPGAPERSDVPPAC